MTAQIAASARTLQQTLAAAKAVAINGVLAGVTWQWRGNMCWLAVSYGVVATSACMTRYLAAAAGVKQQKVIMTLAARSTQARVRLGAQAAYDHCQVNGGGVGWRGSRRAPALAEARLVI